MAAFFLASAALSVSAQAPTHRLIETFCTSELREPRTYEVWSPFYLDIVSWADESYIERLVREENYTMSDYNSDSITTLIVVSAIVLLALALLLYAALFALTAWFCKCCKKDFSRSDFVQSEKVYPMLAYGVFGLGLILVSVYGLYLLIALEDY